MVKPGDRPDSVTLGVDVMVTRRDVLSWCDPVSPASGRRSLRGSEPMLTMTKQGFELCCRELVGKKILDGDRPVGKIRSVRTIDCGHEMRAVALIGAGFSAFDAVVLIAATPPATAAPAPAADPAPPSPTAPPASGPSAPSPTPP